MTILSSVDNDGEYVIYIRGIGNSINYKWVLTDSDISCIGNIENLLDYATVKSGAHPTMASYCYSSMFQDCTSLTQAPAIPATTLADYCYQYMFQNAQRLNFRQLRLGNIRSHIVFLLLALVRLQRMLFLSCSQTQVAPSINTTYYLSSDNMVVRET